VRVTWVQPEDLLGYELRQARQEGKDVDAIEERWLAAGGKPAPAGGASHEPAAPALRALALVLLDEIGSSPRPLTVSTRFSPRRPARPPELPPGISIRG
jgi:hypothetical protein